MSEPGRDDERLQDLIRAELGDDTIELTVARGRVVAASRDLVGLALSGGGIRSATFNLGLLQGLERIGLLERLDYLSTVSGGGYVGGFWTAWRARQAASDGPATFPVRSDGGSGAEHPVIRHLREFSNFLAPHLGLLSWDTGRMVVTLASSLVPSLLAAFSLIALVILAWCLVAYGLFHDAAIRSVLTLVVFSTALLGVMELFWQARGEESDPLGYWLAWLIGVGVATASWWALIEADGALLTWDGARLPIVADDRPWQQGFHLWAPALSWIAASVALSLIRWFFSRSIDRHRDRVRQNSFDRVHARFLFAAAAWTVISALWWIGTLVWGLAEQGWASAAGLTTGLGGATAAVVLLFSRIQKRFSAGSKSTLGAGVMAAVRLLLPRAARPVAAA